MKSVLEKVTMSLLLIFYLFFTSCEKCPDPLHDCINPPCDTSVIKPITDTNIVWQYNADTGRNACLSMIPVLYNNTVVFSRRTSLPDGFMFFDKKSGKLNNLYEDLESPTWKSGATYQYKQFSVVTDWYEVFLLDLSKNEVERKINLRDNGYDGEPRISGLGEWVFIPVRINGHPRKNYTNTWLRWNMLTDEYQEVLTIEDSRTFEAGFESLAFWFKPDGDTVMIFQNRQYDFINRERRIDMYAYNMSKRTYEWKIDSFTITGNTSIHPIKINGDRLYFQGSNEVFCFNCKDGRLIWSRYFPGESFFNTAAILADNKIILQSETDLMLALDLADGHSIWENPKAGGTDVSSKNLIYHNGRVIYQTGQDGLGVLRALDVQSGNIVWTYFPSNYKKYSNVSFGGGLAFDPETEYLYVNDRVFHMCIKLPK